MRERGLKLDERELNALVAAVAPHAGAWIEMRKIISLRTISCVAPHAGAWIEIFACGEYGDKNLVAPHAGAWIEMGLDKAAQSASNSRSPCGSVD